MGYVRGRIADRIGEMRKALNREPRVLVVKCNRIAGVVKELHEDGVVFETANAEQLTQKPDGVTVINIPFWDRAKMVFYRWDSGEVVMIEEPDNAVVTPIKRLVLPT